MVKAQLILVRCYICGYRAGLDFTYAGLKKYPMKICPHITLKAGEVKGEIVLEVRGVNQKW